MTEEAEESGLTKKKKKKKKTSQVRDAFSQPTGPLSDSAELCLVKKKK